MLAAIAVAMLILGFMLGTRARQLLAASKRVGAAFTKLFGLRIPVPDADDAADDADKGGEDDNEMDDEEEAGNAMLDTFLTNDAEAAIDEHADTIINPVLLYQVRIAADKRKVEQRQQERRRMLEAEGVDPDAIEAMLTQMEESGSMLGSMGGGKPSALSVLIENGARVTPLASSGGVEAAAAQERQRQRRSVEFFLRTIEVAVDKHKSKTRNAKGVQLKSAYDVARETQRERVGGSSWQRVERNVPVAKLGRSILRDWKERRDADKKRRGEEDPEDWDENSDGETVDKDKITTEMMGLQKRTHGGGGAINQADLLKLAAEMGEEDLIPEYVPGEDDDVES